MDALVISQIKLVAEYATMFVTYSRIKFSILNFFLFSILAVFAYNEPTFGTGSGIIWLTNVSCNGSEANFLDCPSDSALIGTSCTHATDAAVKCIAGSECITQTLNTVDRICSAT